MARSVAWLDRYIVCSLTCVGCCSDSERQMYLQAAAEWVLEGFSATLLAFGQSGTGKSSTLFGPKCSSTEPILPAVLHSLFNSCSSNSLRVGVSCWEIVQHELVDLLADRSGQLCTYQVRLRKLTQVLVDLQSCSCYNTNALVHM